MRLKYVSTEDVAGYSRKKWGRGFIYLDPTGKKVEDEDLIEWMKSLAIPPAWKDVWISPYQNAHLLATGRDNKGRKQYRYHAEWQRRSNEQKYHQLYDFGQALPHIREMTEQHLRQQNLSKERILAAIVRLLETTLIRIGNEEYAQANDSYGLTTLTDDHATIQGSTIEFDFVGKSGKEHTILLRDRRLARIVKQCQDIPGYALFQYYDDAMEPRVIDSSDVNDYLRGLTGQDFTAKIFRTWGGSTLAIKFLCESCADSPTKTATKSCIAHVADQLGNTKAISRQYYIYPQILDAHVDGTLQAIYADRVSETDQSPYGLAPEERTLMDLIEKVIKT